MRIIKETHIDFFSHRRKIILLSAVVILIGAISVGIHRGFNTSIDFAGGTLVEVRFDPAVPLQKVRDAIEGMGYQGAEVTNFGSVEEVLIKVKNVGEAAEAATRIETSLKENFSASTIDVRRVESVGPKIGGELQTAAFWAILYSFAGLVVYITWRFEFTFAIAAIIALIHNVLVTLTFFSLTNLEISLNVVAALLTVVGYSINDTIVVFDRIREDLRSRGRQAYEVTINGAINETLSRTMVTGLTTIFVLIILSVFGGPVILDFALCLLVGILIGTYSSIFIASPILVEWEAWRAQRKKRVA
jgi:preprotein translocase subunit SecF